MELQDIDVNSEEYAKLFDYEKLVVVRLKIKNLFNAKGKHNKIIKYKGESQSVPSEMIGVYNDLREREKKLEKNIILSKMVDAELERRDHEKDDLSFDFLDKIDILSQDYCALSIDEKIMLLQRRLGISFDLNVCTIESPEYSKLSDEDKILLINSKKAFVLFLHSYTLTFHGYSEIMLALANVYKELSTIHDSLYTKVKESISSGANVKSINLTKTLNFLTNVSLEFTCESKDEEKKYVEYSDRRYESLTFNDAKNLSIANKIMFIVKIRKDIDNVYDLLLNMPMSNGLNLRNPKFTLNYLNDLRNDCCSKFIELSRRLSKVKNKKKDNVKNINEETVNYEEIEFLSSNEYLNLTNEEKIRTIDTRLNFIFEMPKTKKIEDKDLLIVMYRDELRVIPSSLHYVYDVLTKRLQELEKDLKVNYSNPEVIEGSSDYKEESENNRKSTCYDRKKRHTSLFTFIPFRHYNRNDRVSTNKEKKENNLFAKIKKIFQNNKHKNSAEKNGKKKNRKENIFAMVKNKMQKRHVKTAIGATILAAITLFGASLSNDSSKKGNKGNNDFKSSTVQENDDTKRTVTESTQKDVIFDDTIINKVEGVINDFLPQEEDDNKSDNIDVSETNDETNDENSVYELGNIINIDDSANVYNNSYDATSEVNSFSPLISGEEERIVVGVVYELNGNVYTVYSYDDDANEKIDWLCNNGAVQTAVLVTSSIDETSYDYEGYYNAKDVNLLTRTR